MGASITNFVVVNVNVADAPIEKFEFGSLLGVFDHSVTANRQDGPFFSIEEVNAAGFTSAAEPAVNAWATTVFAQDDGVKSLLIGRQDAGDANWTATMDAVEAADPDSWYITNIESRAEADILEVAAWTEARFKIFGAQTSDAAVVAGTPGNVMEDLQGFGYHRTFSSWHETNGIYLDGGWSSSGGGFQLDAPAGRGIWAYQQLEGVTRSNVTPTQANTIFGYNGNINTLTSKKVFTAKGQMASGRFIDITTTVDWLQKRMEEALLQAFLDNIAIAYTNAGMNRLRQAGQEVYDKANTNGHFDPEFVHTMQFPLANEVSAATKATRELTVTGVAQLAGGIQKVNWTINLQQ